ncbi:unnamed protein product [Spirodela intermedia]|uniref:4-coumarate--CoA ligase n=1 Tax=Spirodela intermedia TaxID=51605 RepID=A0A7I8JDY6_SPIIN|nr:unnamed protein product [Spirodela intermedia]CAA6668368.1 unnamed protein product [Spirodela intermedia]
MNPYFIGLVVPVVFTFMLRKNKDAKRRGLPVDVGGEPGYAIRNYRFTSPVETAWEGISTLLNCLRNHLISRETEVTTDGRSFEKLHLGIYQWVSYGQTFEDVSSFASGLVGLGHGQGERAAIFADTRAEWFISLQACFRRNITVVTIYASLGEEALCHSLNETEVSTVICGGKEFQKLVQIKDEGISTDVSLAERNTNWKVISFAEVKRLGRENPAAAQLPASADVAVIMYTSGSTGLPKGVMMTHGNVLATVSAVMTIVPGLRNEDVYLAYLPLAHILELAAEVWLLRHLIFSLINSFCCNGRCWMCYRIWLPADSYRYIKQNKKSTKGDSSVLAPTLMTAVPAILDRVRDGVRKKVDTKGGLSKKLFDIAYNRRLRAINGSWLGAWGTERVLWDFLVFKKVRAILGGQIRFLLSGGAPLSGDTQRFINICLGAPIGQGYGLTETCAGGTFSEFDDTSVGRVGSPLPCSFIKLVDWPEGGYLINDSPMPRGEIVIGGPNVTAGYFKNEEKTKEVYKVDERGMRWFYTGDVGQFHSDGCLEIIDRKKDIVKLQHGEYVSLGKVEAVLVASPYVDNVMVHVDSFYSYCVALVVPLHQALEDWAKKQGLSYSDFSDLCLKEEAVKEVKASLGQAAKQGRLEKFEIPLKIKILPEPWTPESGLVTAALKLKREVIKKQFAEDLAKLYS